MAFEGLLDSLKSSGNNIKDKILESSLAQNIQDRFQNLNPSQQKLTLLILNILGACIILYFPIDHYLTSNDYTLEFEEKRILTKNLIKSHRDVNHLPDIPQPQSADMVKSIIESQLKEMNLLPEQIRYVNITSGSSKIIPLNKLQYGIEVGVSKLNLKQITNLGSKLQSLHPALKLKDLLLTANREDGRYQDGTFKLVALNVPKYMPPPPEPETKKGKKPSKTSDGESE